MNCQDECLLSGQENASCLEGEAFPFQGCTHGNNDLYPSHLQTHISSPFVGPIPVLTIPWRAADVLGHHISTCAVGFGSDRQQPSSAPWPRPCSHCSVFPGPAPSHPRGLFLHLPCFPDLHLPKLILVWFVVPGRCLWHPKTHHHLLSLSL